MQGLLYDILKVINLALPFTVTNGESNEQICTNTSEHLYSHSYVRTTFYSRIWCQRTNYCKAIGTNDTKNVENNAHAWREKLVTDETG